MSEDAEPLTVLGLWTRTLDEPLGLYLKCASLEAQQRLKSLLYTTRWRLTQPGKAHNPALAAALEHIQVRTSPADPQGTLWLVNAPRTSP